MLELPERALTYGEIVTRMSEIENDVEQARAFRDLLVERAMQAQPGMTQQQVLKQTNENLGYLLGYGGVQHVEVWEEIGCRHPILGSLQREISPEEAFRKGVEYGERLKEKKDRGNEHR